MEEIGKAAATKESTSQKDCVISLKGVSVKWPESEQNTLNNILNMEYLQSKIQLIQKKLFHVVSLLFKNGGISMHSEIVIALACLFISYRK